MKYHIDNANFCWLVTALLMMSSSWVHAAADYIVAPSGGDITGAELSARLATESVTLKSNRGIQHGWGNVIINDDVSWSADTTLTIIASANVKINANLTASGDTAGLTISPNTANGSESASGNGRYMLGDGVSITHTGATPALTIARVAYTVINHLGVAEDATVAPATPTLQGIAATANLGKHFVLGSDIDASATSGWNSGAGFTPIGQSTSADTAFTGSFDGLGHTINAITINAPTDAFVGLFGYTNPESLIQNVGLTDSNVIGSRNVGMLVGHGAGTLNNCFVAGTVSGVTTVGGLVGSNYGSVSDSYTSANVSGEPQNGTYIGGLVGAHWNGSITNSYTTGNVSGSSAVGGLIGKNSSQVHSSYATGDTSGGNSIGGLVGSNFGGAITGSYATGSAKGNMAIGGLVGSNQADVGSYGSDASISNSYATGSVTGTGTTPGQLGGLVGSNNGTAVDQYKSYIRNSYATGSMSGTNFLTGGLVGNNDWSGISDCYWNKDVYSTGIAGSVSQGATGLTTAQMKQLSSFAGWNIADTGESGAIWRIYDGMTPPLLRSFLKPLTLTPNYNGINGETGLYSTTAANGLDIEKANMTFSSTSTPGTMIVKLNVTTDQQGYDVSGATSRTITGTGSAANDLNFNESLSWSAGGVILKAQNNIHMNASLNASGSATVELQYGQGAAAVNNSSRYDFNNGGKINLPSGGNRLTTRLGSDGVTKSYIVLTDLGEPGSNGGEGIQGLNGNSGTNYALGADIDASTTSEWSDGKGFSPLDASNGMFDGLGHTIDHLTIHRPEESSVGLFGNLQGSFEVRNLNLTNADVQGLIDVGLLVGYNSAVVEFCSTDGVVGGGNQVGGLVGYNISTTAVTALVNNSHSTATVNGAGNVGGLVGQNEANTPGNALLTNNDFGGSVTGTQDNVGGLVGFNGGGTGVAKVDLSHTTLTSNVTGAGNVGGLVGYNDSARVSNSHNEGVVQGSSRVGGLVGMSFGGGNASATIENSFAFGQVTGANSVGGLVGQNQATGTGTALITGSYATARVVASQNSAGGLVGINGGGSGTSAINLSYATGSVSGINDVGGLVGNNIGVKSTINSIYAAGKVSGVSQVGGLLGFLTSGKVNGAFWNTTTSGQSLSAGGGQGLSSTEMRTASSFIGFDFTSPQGWVIVDADGTLNNAKGAMGATYPLLASEYSTRINTAHQLQLMAMHPAASYTLTGTVDASGTAGGGDIWSDSGFVPVGGYAAPFSGKLNGGGFFVNGLYANWPSNNRVGLIGNLSTIGVVQNINLIEGAVSGSGSVGSVVGINNGTVENCTTSAAVTGVGGFVGGLIGKNKGTVSSSEASGDVDGTGGYIGGLVGFNEAMISGCSATGTVTGKGGFSGPLVGVNIGTIN